MPTKRPPAWWLAKHAVTRVRYPWTEGRSTMVAERDHARRVRGVPCAAIRRVKP